MQMTPNQLTRIGCGFFYSNQSLEASVKSSWVKEPMALHSQVTQMNGPWFLIRLPSEAVINETN